MIWKLTLSSRFGGFGGLFFFYDSFWPPGPVRRHALILAPTSTMTVRIKFRISRVCGTGVSLDAKGTLRVLGRIPRVSSFSSYISFRS